MSARLLDRRNMQLAAVTLSAAAVKLHYSTATVEGLRWVLAPTAFLVSLVTGRRFEFEAGAGYESADRGFVIAASCAGVNFLIASFLLLTLRRLLSRGGAGWGFIPRAALCAYLSALVANTIRITGAISLRESSFDAGWLSPAQLHRVEGILVYFGCLLLLLFVSERRSADAGPRPVSTRRRAWLFVFPLLVYYATTLGLPLLNGAYARGADFREHTAFVLLTPLLLVLPLGLYRVARARLASAGASPSESAPCPTGSRTLRPRPGTASWTT